jgi:hypothetical protein
MDKNYDRDIDSPNVSTKIRNVTTYRYHQCLTFKCIIFDMMDGMDKYDGMDNRIRWYINHKTKNKPRNPMIK